MEAACALPRGREPRRRARGLRRRRARRRARQAHDRRVARARESSGCGSSSSSPSRSASRAPASCPSSSSPTTSRIGYGPDRALVVVRLGRRRPARRVGRRRGARTPPCYELVLARRATTSAPSSCAGSTRSRCWGRCWASTRSTSPTSPRPRPRRQRCSRAPRPRPEPQSDRRRRRAHLRGRAARARPRRASLGTRDRPCARRAAGRATTSRVLAYLPDDDALLEPLHAVVPPVSAELGVADHARARATLPALDRAAAQGRTEQRRLRARHHARPRRRRRAGQAVGASRPAPRSGRGRPGDARRSTAGACCASTCPTRLRSRSRCSCAGSPMRRAS